MLFQTLLLVMIGQVLSSTMVGLCHAAHAAEEVLCKQCPPGAETSSVTSLDEHDHSCPDADHEGPDHCASTCYCSCHLPVTTAGLQLRYAPVITVLLLQETFTPPQDIFLSLFVPPDNLA